VIVGIGVDLVDVARFERSLQRTPGLLARLFTARERDRPPPRLAARFAAKEAVAKALGAPGGLAWHDVEIVSGADGRPSIRVAGTVAEAARGAGVTTWHVSLSHDAGCAVAVVVAESVP
jgi:holo-[acyl-carrier protein] synthase